AATDRCYPPRDPRAAIREHTEATRTPDGGTLPTRRPARAAPTPSAFDRQRAGDDPPGGRRHRRGDGPRGRARGPDPRRGADRRGVPEEPRPAGGGPPRGPAGATLHPP